MLGSGNVSHSPDLDGSTVCLLIYGQGTPLLVLLECTIILLLHCLLQIATNTYLEHIHSEDVYGCQKVHTHTVLGAKISQDNRWQ
jgi:hypothetical protein